MERIKIADLLHREDDLSGIEQVALLFWLFIGIVPLSGVIRIYAFWCIRLYAVLISFTIFILAISLIAWCRRRKLAEAKDLSFPSTWGYLTEVTN